MAGDVPITRGDCVDSLSYDAKVKSDTVWDHPNNKKLKDTYKDRNVLMPGENLYMPDPELQWERDKKTGQTHIFKRTLPKKKFKFQIVQDKARTTITHTVKVDGLDVPAVAAGEWLECEIPPNAKEAVITLTYNRGQLLNYAYLKTREYKVKLGHVRPVTTAEGQEDRLRNMGFFAPLPDGAEPTLVEALERFQTSYGIEPADGVAGDDTINKLKELTGDPA